MFLKPIKYSLRISITPRIKGLPEAECFFQYQPNIPVVHPLAKTKPRGTRSRSSSQEIPQISWHPNVHYDVNKSLIIGR